MATRGKVTWDYKVLWLRWNATLNNSIEQSRAAVEKDLNSLGLEGWELVAVHNVGKPASVVFDMTYLFKRQQNDT